MESRNNGEGLVSTSFEIGSALVGRKLQFFTAKGTCMYPCLKQGDVLYVDPCSIESAQVGDIAVIRSHGILNGHRIISKGFDDALGAFIVTRPDRNRYDSDAPTYQDGLLGIVSGAERKGKRIQLHPLKLSWLDLLKIELWERMLWQAKPAIVRFLNPVQQFMPYRAIASLYLRVRYPEPVISVHVPLKPMQQSDFFQVIPAADFNLTTVQQKGRAVVEWSVQFEFRKKVPAASVTFVHRPDGCPEGSGWYRLHSWSRIRYRGAGLESRLVDEAQRIFQRSGASCNFNL
ncbi:MAG: hypothetical protein HGA97_03245 [Chlorobiaceae bacterium]|nr:hypothetical protein [Chlorobiaceae bacterium]